MTPHQIAYRLALLGLLVLLVSCGASQVAQPESAEVISSFRTDKGAEASYQVGEEISFSFTLARVGYIELEIRDPDGEVYTLQNLSGYVSAGGHILPEPDSRSLLELGEPVGKHTVTLYYRDESARPNTMDSATLTFEVVP